MASSAGSGLSRSMVVILRHFRGHKVGDLGLKWFDKLPFGSIGSFYQLTESFVARYNKCYWEMYNDLEECLEELVVVSCNVGLTPCEKLSEDLMLKPPADLQDLMSWVKTFARLEDDDGHLKEYINQEKTWVEEANVRPNPRFERGPTPTQQSIGHLAAGPQLLRQEDSGRGDEREVLEDVGRTPEDKVVEDLILYELIEPSSDLFFLTGANLKKRERTEFIEFRKANIEVFTWTPYEMPGIDPNFIKHKLNFSPRTVNPELGCPVFAHSKKGSSAGTSTSTEPEPDGLDIRKEPPQGLDESTTEDINEGVSKFTRNHLRLLITCLEKFNQVTRKFETHGAKMAKYMAIAKTILTEFRSVQIEQVG
ncbi:hypothetical protein Acr_14g0002100 [Actinidia rufa]|uniref:Uncharacterized protein n=1 Tax=Actinidia rufa TaxID=165716 RepID=A0A7J0FPE3_9ERIC|nr:hypothetical protein Acr_14g0002100 [Actinidia rufa]